VSIQLTAQGPFSLAEVARHQESFAGFDGGAQVEFTFPADGVWTTLHVRVTDDLVCHVLANPGRVPDEDVRRHVERILSLDVDARGYAEVGRRDEVVGDLQRRFPGLRPVLFGSPYEAAAWALLTHRISRAQGGSLRRRLSQELGDQGAFPTPERLADLAPMPGLTIRKVENLRALGEAAAAGELDADLLRGLPVEEALTHLKKLPGIGPFSAELTMIRGVGTVDFFPRETPLLHKAMAELYDLGPEPPMAQLEALARHWRPYSAWVAFLLRQVG
jgi:DNA-3-methyladenine glycosylase II